MKPPDLTDQFVKVRAYLTDQDFGYEHWRAAQFSAPNVPSSRYAVLTIFQSEAERDRYLSALPLAHGWQQIVETIQRRMKAEEAERELLNGAYGDDRGASYGGPSERGASLDRDVIQLLAALAAHGWHTEKET